MKALPERPEYQRWGEKGAERKGTREQVAVGGMEREGRFWDEIT